MKKIYQNPTTEIVMVETQAHMLFGSENGDGTISGGGNKGSYEEGSQLSRDGGGWDDED